MVHHHSPREREMPPFEDIKGGESLCTSGSRYRCAAIGLAFARVPRVKIPRTVDSIKDGWERTFRVQVPRCLLR